MQQDETLPAAAAEAATVRRTRRRLFTTVPSALLIEIATMVAGVLLQSGGRGV